MLYFNSKRLDKRPEGHLHVAYAKIAQCLIRSDEVLLCKPGQLENVWINDARVVKLTFGREAFFPDRLGLRVDGVELLRQLVLVGKDIFVFWLDALRDE